MLSVPNFRRRYGSRRKARFFPAKTVRSSFRDSGRRRLQLEPLEARWLLTTITVDSLDDNTVIDGQVTLREAIYAANTDTSFDGSPAGSGADEIRFDPSLFSGGPGAITLGGTELEITDQLIIAGPGSGDLTIDANSQSRVFYVAAGVNAEITSLTMTHGSVVDGGGGILNDGNLIVTDSSVVDSLSLAGVGSTGGGGICNRGSLTVTDSILARNSVSEPTMTSLGYGGGIFNAGTLTIRDSLLAQNEAMSGRSSMGGGIFNVGNLSISNTTFSENSGRLGGAIRSQSPHTTPLNMTIDASTFSGNSARIGGALHSAGTGTITASVFTGNWAENAGAIRHRDGTLTVIDSTISSNWATVTDGGGVANASWGGRPGTMNIINSTITGNWAATNGGGIANERDCALGVTNSTISENWTLSGIGGGVYNDMNNPQPGTVTLNNTIVAGNADLNSTAPDISGLVAAGDYNLVREPAGWSFASGGAHNITSQDPLLGPLDDHGGPTQTMPLLSGSAAIDAGSDLLALDPDGQPLPYDQRGAPFSRIVGGSVDMGAFELQVSSPQEQIAEIGDQILALLDDEILNAGQANSLQTKLEGAIVKLDDGNLNAAVNKLEAFINQVNAFLNSGKLTEQQGQPLIDAAESAIAGTTQTRPLLPDGPATATVTVRVTDNGSPALADDRTFTVSVLDVAPADLAVALSSDTIDEGDTTTLSGSFADPGTLDAHTVTIDWGDGSANTTLALGAGVLNFTAPAHRYVDNLPGDAPYTISVSVSTSNLPRIIATSPVLDQGPIPPTSTIDVTFSKPMDPATFDLRDVGLVNLDQFEASLTGQFGGTFYDCDVVGSLLYAATGAGLQIFDISDPGNITRLGGYVISGYVAWDVQVVGNLAYVVDEHGLYILNVSNPASVTRAGAYFESGGARAVHVVGDSAFLAKHAGLEILDVSDPANVIRLGGYDTPGVACGVHVVGNLAYVADWDTGLQILDISNPTDVILLGGCDTPGHAYRVQVTGNLAYVADQEAGIQILDVSDPANVTQLGRYDSLTRAYSVRVAENMAYVAGDGNGLQILDISNPASLTRMAIDGTSGWTSDMQVVGNRAYVASGDKLQILDVSNLAHVVRLGEYDTPGYAWDAQVVGNSVYLGTEAAGLFRVEVGLPAASISHVTGNTYRIDFGQSLTPGTYALQVGAEISGTGGMAMDQDQDGTPGEDGQDIYFARFVVNNAVTSETGGTFSAATGGTAIPVTTVTVTLPVTVRNVAPTIDSIMNDGPVSAGYPATVTVAASDVAGVYDPLNYEFDFDNDGIYEVGPQAHNTAMHTFLDAGSHTVGVRVTDGDGGEAIGNTLVTVNPPHQPTTYFVDDSLRLDEDVDEDGVLSVGDEVTFALGEAGETGGLIYGTDAFRSIQQSIDEAFDGDTVLVAAGTYDERLLWVEKSIQLIGAGAEETVVDAAASELNPGRGLTIEDVPGTALLEGFTFTGGYAVSLISGSGGGGIRASASSLTMKDNLVTGNVAGSMPSIPGNPGARNNNGGGISIVEGSPTLIGNRIVQNVAARHGGGINLVRTSAILINNVIADNTALRGGGVKIVQPGGAPPAVDVFVNNTIVGNVALEGVPGVGGGMYYLQPVPGAIITNSILWGNEPDDLGANSPSSIIVSYSDVGVTNVVGGDGNISLDPNFVDPDAGNYHLQADSPCIDTGTNADPHVPFEDKDGNPRVVGAAVDMGAYEVQVSSPQDQIQQVLIPQIQTLVDSGVLNGGQGNSFLSKLDGAQASFDQGNVNAGMNKVGAFINQVNAFINSGKLTEEQGQTLIDAAEAVIHSALAQTEAATDAAFAGVGQPDADGDALLNPLNDSLLDDLLATDSDTGNAKGKK